MRKLVHWFALLRTEVRNSYQYQRLKIITRIYWNQGGQYGSIY